MLKGLTNPLPLPLNEIMEGNSMSTVVINNKTTNVRDAAILLIALATSTRAIGVRNFFTKKPNCSGRYVLYKKQSNILSDKPLYASYSILDDFWYDASASFHGEPNLKNTTKVDVEHFIAEDLMWSGVSFKDFMLHSKELLPSAPFDNGPTLNVPQSFPASVIPPFVGNFRCQTEMYSQGKCHWDGFSWDQSDMISWRFMDNFTIRLGSLMEGGSECPASWSHQMIVGGPGVLRPMYVTSESCNLYVGKGDDLTTKKDLLIKCSFEQVEFKVPTSSSLKKKSLSGEPVVSKEYLDTASLLIPFMKAIEQNDLISDMDNACKYAMGKTITSGFGMKIQESKVLTVAQFEFRALVSHIGGLEMLSSAYDPDCAMWKYQLRTIKELYTIFVKEEGLDSLTLLAPCSDDSRVYVTAETLKFYQSIVLPAPLNLDLDSLDSFSVPHRGYLLRPIPNHGLELGVYPNGFVEITSPIKTPPKSMKWLVERIVHALSGDTVHYEALSGKIPYNLKNLLPFKVSFHVQNYGPTSVPVLGAVAPGLVQKTASTEMPNVTTCPEDPDAGPTADMLVEFTGLLVESHATMGKIVALLDAKYPQWRTWDNAQELYDLCTQASVQLKMLNLD